MLFAKFSPVVSVARQDGPFSTSTITADHFTAVTRGYVVGATSATFEVSYGNVTKDGDGKVVDFNQVISTEVTLSESDIADWGTDDSVILDKIAAAQNLTVDAVVSGELSRRGRFGF